MCYCFASNILLFILVLLAKLQNRTLLSAWFFGATDLVKWSCWSAWRQAAFLSSWPMLTFCHSSMFWNGRGYFCSFWWLFPEQLQWFWWIKTYLISWPWNHFSNKTYLKVGRMGYIPAYNVNGNSRNVSCSKPSLHCHKCPREGALYKWLTKSTSDPMHMALYKWTTNALSYEFAFYKCYLPISHNSVLLWSWVNLNYQGW